MPGQDETVEERLDRLETLLEHVLARARQYPAGRVILKMLGLS